MAEIFSVRRCAAGPMPLDPKGAGTSSGVVRLVQTHVRGAKGLDGGGQAGPGRFVPVDAREEYEARDRESAASYGYAASDYFCRHSYDHVVRYSHVSFLRFQVKAYLLLTQSTGCMTSPCCQR